MQPVFFTSVISKKHRDDFERIMFFHSQQNQFTEQITHVINTFGFPTIIESGDALRIVIAGLEDCQTLAAYDSEDDDAVLLGVIVYYRKSVEEVVVLHVAVAEECTSKGEYAEEMIALRLLSRLRDEMKRLKGVMYISIAYSGDPQKLSKIPIID